MPQTVTVQFSKSLFACVGEMLALRGISIENYLIQLAEADVAFDRLEKFQQRKLFAEGEKKIVIQKQGTRMKLTPEQVQRVIFLHDSEGLGVRSIAHRFNVGPTTIQRLLHQRERLVPSAPRPTHGRRWGNSGGGPRP